MSDATGQAVGAPADAADSNARAEEPRWVHELAALWWHELRLFLATAAALLRDPRGFGRAWADGRLGLRVMNPLTFVALSWPVLLPLDYGLPRLMGWDRRTDVAFMVELARALRPYLLLAPMSLLLFACFRLLGSRRRLATTAGLLFYWMVLVSAAWVAGLFGCWITGVRDWLCWLMSALTLPWAAFALAGAHGKPWPLCLAAVLPAAYLAPRLLNPVLEWLGWS